MIAAGRADGAHPPGQPAAGRHRRPAHPGRRQHRSAATIAALLLKAGDAWSAWVLQASTGGQFTQRLTLLLNLGGGAAPAVVLVFGADRDRLSLVQAVLMLFRQAALIILAGVLPLAAAGSIAPMTRTWVRKVTAWMLALICYKPAAAAVYATAFTMIGSGGSPRTALMGFVMLLLSVLTLPALMKFFTWTTGTIAGSGGGGQLLGAATVGAIAVGAMRSSGGGVGAGPGRLPRLPARPHRPRRRPRAAATGGPPSGRARPRRTGQRPARRATAARRRARQASPACASAAGTGPLAGAMPPSGAADASHRRPRPAGPAGSQRPQAPAPRPPPAAAGPAAAAAAAGAQLAADTARLATGAMDRRRPAMTSDHPGAHLRRMAAQPQHRPARPRPGRDVRPARLLRRAGR